MGKKINLEGKKFGKLQVLSLLGSKSGKTQWECRCECGKICHILSVNLTNSNTKSCGCFQREEARKRLLSHGGKGTAIYGRWLNMHLRCRANHPSAKSYFYRNITVCEEWSSFLQFKKDMEGGFKPELQLDRIDNDKGYFKENCRWATKSENIMNRTNTLYTQDGTTKMSVKDYALKYNLNYSSVKSRVYKEKNMI